MFPCFHASYAPLIKMEPIIQTKHMDVVYNLGKKNEFKAITDFNLDIYPGEFIALFGPSGCGKSTIFYSILGILQPSSGEILIKGENPYAFSANEMVNYQSRIIGIIYQAFFLINSISVMDNVVLPQAFLGIPWWKRKKRGQELLDRFGIGNKAENFPMLLSGGQSQRVSVARSMVNNPDILLADEPTGNLDSKSSEQVMRVLDEINKKDKKTVIMITHNASQLVWCHRVFYMKDGQLLRTVPNPDKKQIIKFDRQKVLVTEIELLSQMFPYFEPEDLKVKSLVNYLTQDLDFLQIDRLEKAVKLMILRTMGRDNFQEILNAPLARGGVGLPRTRAKFLADKVGQLLKHSEDVRRYRRRMNEGTFFSREDKLINELLYYIVEEAEIKLDRDQKSILKQAVRDRVSGLIRKEELEIILKNPVKKGGVGLDKTDREKIVFYFEKLLTQGIDTANKS
ncbi:MAG: ABC transporter ATP-binding protein [Patescibacteria group bacterium]|nr:ABC transporter ATP-binding protein [Patescibacteria group bacterium]